MQNDELKKGFEDLLVLDLASRAQALHSTTKFRNLKNNLIMLDHDCMRVACGNLIFFQECGN